MRGTITLQISSNEAISILSAEGLPTSITRKVTAALRGNTEVTPIGRRASVAGKKKINAKSKVPTEPVAQAQTASA